MLFSAVSMTSAAAVVRIELGKSPGNFFNVPLNNVQTWSPRSKQNEDGRMK